jgi:hypothetical protein
MALMSQNNLPDLRNLPLFQVVAYKETEDTHLEIGVLEDGTSFMTGRSLARAAGISSGTMSELTTGWTGAPDSARNAKMMELLNAHGASGHILCVPAVINGTSINAYPGPVCMAILEYYSYSAGQNCKTEALASFRYLAQKGFSAYVYEATGYGRDDSLAAYFDRVSLNNIIPTGFFSVFKEADELIVALISQGLPADPTTVPDISIGMAWASQWRTGGHEQKYGARRKFPHKYPSSYPQSMAATDSWIYPDEALPEYRKWMREVYIPTKLKPYLEGKALKGQLEHFQVERIIEAVKPLMLQHGPRRPGIAPGKP